jgi:alpha-L-fucosidase 2
MSRFTRRRFLATAPAVAGVLSAGKRLGWSEPEKSNPDNLTLWYTSPAREWVDAFPIGNGHLGAMVFGGSWTNPVSAEKASDRTDHANASAEVDPAKETMQLNADTLWSGMPVDGNNLQAKEFLPEVRRAVLEEKDYHKADELCKKMQGLFAEAYQLIGSLHVDCKHEEAITKYRRDLHLANAVTRTRYKAGDVWFERTAFASAPDQAIVLRISADEPGALNASIWMDGPLVKLVEAEGGNRLLLTGKAAKHVAGAGHPGSEKPVVLSDAPGEGMYFSAVLEARVEGGRVKADGDRLNVEGAKACTIILTAATGYKGFDQKPDTPQHEVNAKARRQLDAAVEKSYPVLRQRHEADFRQVFERVSLRLGSDAAAAQPTDVRLKNFAAAPDASLLALYFQFGRYLLISSSRPGSQPANLQGIWNYQVQPPWSSNWTSNINIQMNYWPAESCNLSDCTEPLATLIADLSKTGARAARETYGLPGWVSHHNIDVWRAANPVGAGVGQPTWANWCMSGPWLCAHLYDHYQFTLDREFLRTKAYPVMKGSAEFYLSWLIEDGNGHLTTCPSESTENDFMAPDGKKAMTSAGCTMDMALIRELFQNCIASAKELHTDAEFAAKLAAARDRLVPFQVGRWGQLRSGRLILKKALRVSGTCRICIRCIREVKLRHAELRRWQKLRRLRWSGGLRMAERTRDGAARGRLPSGRDWARATRPSSP